jgi:uncharacterized integral membrane protein
MLYRVLATISIFFLTVFFVALNWSVFYQSATLDLLFGYVEAPFGIVILVMLGILLSVYSLMEVAALIESRRSAKELEEARKVALSREASRIHELEKLLAEELKDIKHRLEEVLRRLNSEKRPVVNQDF